MARYDRLVAPNGALQAPGTMRQILVISSHVAYGTIGLAPTVAPLQQAGIEVTTLPTIVLSNHPGLPRVAGKAVEPVLLEDMTAALDANGWLGTFDAILSGYLPSAEHAAWVRAVVERLRELNPAVVYVCDPILGDDPDGLYIDDAAAEAVREMLLPVADVLTPNRFELAWLSGVDVQSVEDAVSAARILARPKLAATSIPSGIPSRRAELANVLITERGVLVGKVEKLDRVPHGTGDLFAGLFTAELLQGAPDAAALGRAAGGVKHALDVSHGSDRLLLSMMDWTHGIEPARIESLS
jgi:pyridoxine kinase